MQRQIKSVGNFGRCAARAINPKSYVSWYCSQFTVTPLSKITILLLHL